MRKRVQLVMGWASAGYGIFDPVMRAMIESGCPDETITAVAGTLIDVLTNDDWDTVDESADTFSDVPAVVRAINERGYWSHKQFTQGNLVTIRCHGCDRLVEYKLGPDDSPISWVHAMSGQADAKDVCPYSGKSPSGY